VVEGLDQLTDLRELYVENQQLPSGEKLLFDPRTLVALAHSLNVLNVSGNRLNNLSDFTCLENLTQLIATNNQLTDFKELQRLLCRLTVLWRLELTGNPMCLRSKYRERVTIMSMSLIMLDGKEINETSRQFLINWQASKDARHQQRERRRRQASMQTVDSHDTIEDLQLPPAAFLRKGLMTSSYPSQFKAMISATGDGDGAVDRKVVRLPNIFAPPRYLHNVGDRNVWVPGTRSMSSQVQQSTLSEQTKGTSSVAKPVDIL
jgi:protein phosphatase 1 regulatory subunit 42